MCRLLGYVSPTATTVDELIGTERCDAFRDMSRLHSDGWGSVSVQHGHLERIRSAAPADRSVPLDRTLGDTTAAARIVHLRMATPGLGVNLDNTHPFLASDTAFAHNGVLRPVAALHDLVRPEIRATLEGTTDSELYFALIRQHRADGNTWFDATCHAAATLHELFPTASLNALLLNTEQLIAVHVSETAPVPVKELSETGLSAEQMPRDHLTGYFQMSYRRTEDGACVFTSSGIDTAGWTPMPPASVAAVDLRSRELTTRSLLPASVPSAR